MIRDHLPRGGTPEQLLGSVVPLAPSESAEAIDPEVVPPEHLDRRATRLLVDLRKASRDLPRTTEQLGKLHQRIDRLEEKISHAQLDPSRAFILQRLRSLADRVSHQYYASRVIEAAASGLEEDYELALSEYRALAVPRLIPEPPVASIENQEEETPSSVHLTDRLAERVVALHREVSRYEQATASHEDPEAPVVRLWSERLEDLRKRQDRVEELVERHREASQELEKIPSDPEHLPELALKGSDIARLEIRLEAVTRLVTSSRAIIESLNSAVEEARSTRAVGPLAEVIRAHRLIVERDSVQSEIGKETSKLESMQRERVLNQKIDDLDRSFDSELRNHLRAIYRHPERVYKNFKWRESKEQPEGLLMALRKDPSELGPFKRMVFPSKLRADITAMLDRYAEHQAQRDDLVDKKIAREALVENVQDSRDRLDRIPERDQLLASLYASYQSLSREERATLPPEIRALGDDLEIAAREHAETAGKTLRALAQLAGRVSREQLKRATLRHAPDPVRSLYALSRSLKALQKQGPGFLIKASVRRLIPLPPHIAAALRLVQIAAFVVKILTRGRSRRGR